jgi:hypothetical protein
MKLVIMSTDKRKFVNFFKAAKPQLVLVAVSEHARKRFSLVYALVCAWSSEGARVYSFWQILLSGFGTTDSEWLDKTLAHLIYVL